MFKPGGLTPKQNTFVANYISNGMNATQAAKSSGYSSPDAQGTRLLQNVRIQAVISEKLKQIEKATLVDAEYIISKLLTIVDRCTQGEPVLNAAGYETGVWTFNAAGANKALELLGKTLGIWIEKAEVNVKGPVSLVMEIVKNGSKD